MRRYRSGQATGSCRWGVWALLSLALLSCEKPAPPQAQVDDEPDSLQVIELNGIKNIISETASSNKLLVIDFWATWCAPCVEMLPTLHEGLVARGDRVRAVTVTLDDPTREPAARAFLAEQDALHDAYIFASDSKALQALADGLGEKWNSLAVPAILVYDSKGNLVGEFLEGGATKAILDQVDRLLASGLEP